MSKDVCVIPVPAAAYSDVYRSFHEGVILTDRHNCADQYIISAQLCLSVNIIPKLKTMHSGTMSLKSDIFHNN